MNSAARSQRGSTPSPAQPHEVLTPIFAPACATDRIGTRALSSFSRNLTTNAFNFLMAGGGRRRRAAAAARQANTPQGNEMVMMNQGMMGGTSFAHGQHTLSNTLHQQETRDTKLGIGKAADDEALSAFDPRAWFTEMSRFALFLIFFSITIFSGKQGRDIYDCE